MKIVTHTGIGLREKNEDAFNVLPLQSGGYLLVVADGMGGYDAGEVASKAAAEALSDSLYQDSKDIFGAVLKANLALDSKKRNLGVKEMGCTVVGVVIEDRVADIFWVGDSRVYVFRNDRIIFQTEDHSLVNEMKKIKVLTPRQIKRYEHIVRRSLMGNESDVVDTVELKLNPGDEVLVCSDGIHKEIPIPFLLEKLRTEERFSLDNEKFEDNHTLIYAVID